MTDDETIATMFDEGKRFVTDEAMLAEAEFAEACDEYIRAARKFEKLDRIAKAQNPRQPLRVVRRLGGAVPSRQKIVAAVRRRRPLPAQQPDVLRVPEDAAVWGKASRRGLSRIPRAL